MYYTYHMVHKPHVNCTTALLYTITCPSTHTSYTHPPPSPHRYEVEHDGYCITVFSAPNYCDQMGNKGAFIRFHGDDMAPHFTTYNAVPHPPVRAMQYAAPMLTNMMMM